MFSNKRRLILAILWLLFGRGILSDICRSENIDPSDQDMQYAWSENAGWLNFEPSQGPGVHVSGEKLVGWVWAENTGWISLSCQNTNSCGDVDYGVVNDGSGGLSGFAWGENVGWNNFGPVVPGDPADYGVRIGREGDFSGWAWGQNIGWIHFGLSDYYVVACKVTIEDLASFCDQWLDSGDIPANLDSTGLVDFYDFSFLAEAWWDFCPDGWQLKSRPGH